MKEIFHLVEENKNYVNLKIDLRGKKTKNYSK